MYEIELKAHVYNKPETVRNIERFAKFEKAVERDDTYYHRPLSKPLNGKDYISVRIRRETETTEEGRKTRILLTYKKKELRTGTGNTKTEVNDEKECILSEAEPFEAFIRDDGFTVSLKKFKKVEDYTFHSDFGEATIELCNVSRLGDFIEIEILSPVNDAETVLKIQTEIREVLKKCGISEECIENRYYSEMLADLDKK